MPWLISYDIEDNSIRDKVAKRVQADGFIRLQYSVFGGNPRKYIMDDLIVWLKKTVPIDEKSNNRLLILGCTQTQLDKAQIWGSKPIEWDLLIDPPNTLII